MRADLIRRIRVSPHDVLKAYEGYLAEVGRKEVVVEGYKQNPISGRMEILYARRSKWIADAPA